MAEKRIVFIVAILRNERFEFLVVLLCVGRSFRGFRGFAPRRRGSGQANKAERIVLLAGTIRGATWLGSEGKAFPFWSAL